MSQYHIVGRSGAGSLIIEFLFREAGVDYGISFPSPSEVKKTDFYAANPLGRIPILICPDGSQIFETLAIVNHITIRHEGLAPPIGTTLWDRHQQYLALLATSIYTAYHRQHHTKNYGDESCYESIREHARREQAKIFDYLEVNLTPYVCGESITAVDFYLYMLSRWDVDKASMRSGRPNLNALLDEVRRRPSVEEALASQPR